MHWASACQAVVIGLQGCDACRVCDFPCGATGHYPTAMRYAPMASNSFQWSKTLTSVLAAICPLAATAGTPMPGKVLSPQHSKPARPHGPESVRQSVCMPENAWPWNRRAPFECAREGGRAWDRRGGPWERPLPGAYAWAVGAVMPPQEALVRHRRAHLRARALNWSTSNYHPPTRQ